MVYTKSIANSETKTCQNCKNEFAIEPEDFAFYEKMEVLPPAICPDCRFVRRALFRNERSLYTRKCDLCESSVISMYHPKSSYKIYCNKCFLSDGWDPYEYGVDYDFSRPFFDQFKELMRKVPKSSLFIGKPSINSEYTNVSGGNNNCYLVFNTADCEDSMYCRGLFNSREVLDSYYGTQLERSYEVVNAHHDSGMVFAQNSMGDIDSIFMLNTSGCQDCFGCVNLRHQKNSFFNEKLDSEEYKKRVKDISGSYSKMEKAGKDFEELSLKFPRRENTNLKTENCFGNYLTESKNLQHCFECSKCEDCKYCFAIKGAKDCYDQIGRGLDSELLLEGVSVGHGCQRVIGSYAIGYSSRIEYSFDLRSSKDCFGCDGLKGAEYCVLNKRYNREEYEKIRDHIVAELKDKKEYGLFFSPDLAPFAYNETIAQENFPITKQEAHDKGYRWQDELQKTTGKETLEPEDIPDYIGDVKDSIVDEILKCVACSRNYKVIPAELAFYRKMVLPLPRKCFDCRHMDRIRRRGPLRLFSRQCSFCDRDIQTSYAPDRPEIVYCEQCYQAEVV